MGKRMEKKRRCHSPLSSECKHYLPAVDACGELKSRCKFAGRFKLVPAAKTSGEQITENLFGQGEESQ